MKLVKKRNLKINSNKRGFTLIELLVVMSILGVLVTLIGSSFRTAQIRGRDAERKSDLKQISNALEIFFSDHGRYPSASSKKILACPFISVGGSGVCSWGEGEFTDGNTVYLKEVPSDPYSKNYYYYRLVPDSSNQKYQLFARLENSEDQDCIEGNCIDPVTYSCGESVYCNFSITSSNTSPLE